MSGGADAPLVVLASKGIGLGGAEALMAFQARRPTARVRYHVVHLRRDKDHFAADLRAAGVGVSCVGSGAGWPLALARELRRLRPAVVHSHSPVVAAAARLVVASGVAGRGTRHVYTEHNRWQAYRVPTRAVNAATMVLDRRVWAVSAQASSSVRPPALQRRVEPLVHGIDVAAVRERAAVPDPDERALRRRALGLPEEGILLVCVANRRVEKAHEVLVAGFGSVAADRPDLHLALVGQGVDDPVLGAAIAATGVGDRIHVLGKVDDGAGVIGVADALVLGSDHEGLPVVVMEALALGVPIVSTAVGGVPEVVDDGVSGLLVPRRDPAALGAAMARVHDDPDLRARLAAGAAVGAGRCDGEVAVERLEDAYLALQAGPTRQVPA